MNRVAASTFCLTALLWSITAFLLPEWWASPAFGKTGLPLPLQAASWAVAAVIMAWLWLGRALRPGLAVLGLSSYIVPTFLNGFSIVWFTVEENNVAAIGSAIAWLACASAAAERCYIVMRLTGVPRGLVAEEVLPDAD